MFGKNKKFAAVLGMVATIATIVGVGVSEASAAPSVPYTGTMTNYLTGTLQGQADTINNANKATSKRSNTVINYKN